MGELTHLLSTTFHVLADTFLLMLLGLGVLLVLRKLSSPGSQAPQTAIFPVVAFQRVNTQFDQMRNRIQQSFGQKVRGRRKLGRAKAPGRAPKRRLFVLDYKGDVKASVNQRFRAEVTAVLQAQQPDDEVLVRLESPGGEVSAYGLAATQMERLKASGIKTTVTVDTVAASGGYLMACVADQVLASPFALLGSIGVVQEFPNLHRLLSKAGVDYHTLTAGESKRTVSLLGKIDDANLEKQKTKLSEIHDLFISKVVEHRPALAERAAQLFTGDAWLGSDALEQGLCDGLITSDDYLVQRSLSSDWEVYHVIARIAPGEQGWIAKLRKLLHHSGMSMTL